MELELVKKIRDAANKAPLPVLAQPTRYNMEFAYQHPTRDVLRSLTSFDSLTPLHIPAVGQTVSIYGYDLTVTGLESELLILEDGGALQQNVTVIVTSPARAGAASGG